MSSDLNTPSPGLPTDEESSTTERTTARFRIKILHAKYSSLTLGEDPSGKSRRSISKKPSLSQRVGEGNECPLKSSGNRMPRLSERSVKYEIRSEEHTSELQSRLHLVCRLLLEKKK